MITGDDNMEPVSGEYVFVGDKVKYWTRLQEPEDSDENA